MCHVDSLTDEQYQTYRGLDARIRRVVERALEETVFEWPSRGRSQRIRVAFERVLKALAEPEPAPEPESALVAV